MPIELKKPILPNFFHLFFPIKIYKKFATPFDVDFIERVSFILKKSNEIQQNLHLLAMKKIKQGFQVLQYSQFLLFSQFFQFLHFFDILKIVIFSN